MIEYAALAVVVILLVLAGFKRTSPKPPVQTHYPVPTFEPPHLVLIRGGLTSPPPHPPRFA